MGKTTGKEERENMQMTDPGTGAMIGMAWLKGRLQYSSSPNGTGESFGYYENGVLRFRYPLRNGAMDGLGKTWYENGALKCEEHYRGGVLHGSSCYWYPDGTMEKERYYRRGVFHGMQKDWYSHGTLKAHRTFAEDRLEGPVAEWYPNGRIKAQMNFIRDRKHGLHKFYHEDGSFLLKEIYVRGVRMPVSKYEKLLAGHFSAKKILSIQNQAVRRIFIEEFGYARFLAEMPHEVIDRDGERELVQIDWNPREEPICLVKVKCPSTDAFYTLRVPPECWTVRSAVAWTFDVPVDDYTPEKET